MRRSYYLFLCFTVILTIFLTVFYSQGGAVGPLMTKYRWPTPPYYGISSYFGYRDKPTQNASSYHQGIDILAPIGSGVCAIADGKVVFARFSYLWWIYAKNTTS